MERPLCRNCRHYFITFDKDLPYGCRRFGIKSRQTPSEVVKSAGQGECQGFEAKPSAASKEDSATRVSLK